MNREKQDKTQETPVVSPLANEKTYGERQYSRIFDWGLNYWTNLLASAGFSQWAEHSVKPFKLPFMKETTPRDMQQKLANGVRKIDPFFKSFERKTKAAMELEGKAEHVIKAVVHDRSMARARSLTLLIPGFFVTIPSIWLGAKIKPALVEWFNKRHYGEEAMDDPSLQARHQALAAEARPTLTGAVFARFCTVFAAQATAQMFGSDKNWLQRAGAKNFKGIDPVTSEIGTAIGGTMPKGLQERFNGTAKRWGYDWSLDQRKNAGALKLDVNGAYTNATQDLGRFIVADTIYTAVTAITIRPFMKLLPHLPLIGGLMSYKPKVAANSPTLDGDTVRVPPNRYTDIATDSLARGEATNQPEFADKPSAKVSAVVREHHTLAANDGQMAVRA